MPKACSSYLHSHTSQPQPFCPVCPCGDTTSPATTVYCSVSWIAKLPATSGQTLPAPVLILGQIVQYLSCKKNQLCRLEWLHKSPTTSRTQFLTCLPPVNCSIKPTSPAPPCNSLRSTRLDKKRGYCHLHCNRARRSLLDCRCFRYWSRFYLPCAGHVLVYRA